MQENNKKELPGLGKIFAGQIHYSRIPVEYWQHRILMIKAMGLNALSVYIMWNYHEVSRGNFDFYSDNKNLPLFLQLAEKHEMMVLFRPGPYVCAQWDFGGMPARLLGIDGLVIRANNKYFLQETKIYFSALVPIMSKHLRVPENPKGCIVMLQIQNEYGFYGTDKTYIQAIRNMWKQMGIKTHEYYVDWSWFISRCHWEGANIGINHFDKKLQEMQVRFFQKKGMIMGGEVYTGWMTHWTQKWGGKGIKKVTDNFRFLLQNGHSFAMYVAHGGTNFGFTAGANGLNHKTSDYWGALTSYDYDAPINEQGNITQKYTALRNLILPFTNWKVPQIPKQIQMITIPPFTPTPCCDLFQNISQPLYSDTPCYFQSQYLRMYNQGIVLYETTLPNNKSTFSSKISVHDFALVYLGDRLIEVFDRTKAATHTLNIKQQDLKLHGRLLKILVEASGHINFDKNMETDRKGLYSVSGDLKQVKWSIYRVPLQFREIQKWKKSDMQFNHKTFPNLLIANVKLQKTGDTYLDMSQYGKGYVWVNGRNLGRYWNAGPQLRLFCPGVWLKKGENIIHILNVWGNSGGTIEGVLKLRDDTVIQEKMCQIM